LAISRVATIAPKKAVAAILDLGHFPASEAVNAALRCAKAPLSWELAFETRSLTYLETQGIIPSGTR
jgi:hypothetical protein